MTDLFAHQPRPKWLTCPTCQVMWHSPAGDTCWACGTTGRPSGGPLIRSQYGFAPADFDD